MDATANLANEVVRMVTDRWQDKGSPIFLASLGLRLSPGAKAELRATGMSLKKFIQLHISDKVRLFMIGKTGDALVPVAQTTGLTDAELASRHISVPRPPQFPRYMAAVWRAFERQLLSDKRYIELKDGQSAILHDLSLNEVNPIDSIEVLRDEIPPIDPARGVPAPASVASAIRAWAEKNKIDIHKLYDLSDTPLRKATPSKTAVSPDLAAVKISGAERLRNFLEILEPDEFARINIPSDVLLRILKRDHGP